MNLREKFLGAADFLSEKFPVEAGSHNISLEDLVIILSVALSNEITVCVLCKQLETEVSALLRALSKLKTREHGGKIIRSGFLTIERASNREEQKIALNDKGKELIRELIFYVEKNK